MSADLAGSADPAVLLGILDNGPLWWGLAACGSAQLSKLFIELAVHRRWNPKVLVETGGMPSSHSALLTGTAACLGWQQGFDSPLFALAAALCFVVLYDAAGVRRAAGLTAVRVNALPVALWSGPASSTEEAAGSPSAGSAAISAPAEAVLSTTAAPTAPDPAAARAALKPLKENLGHTRLEVLIGSLMGPLVALPGLVWVGSPLLLARHWGLLALG